MKARIGMSPKLLPILGKNLYQHYNESLVRELVQNSWDACLRANVDPEITVTLEVENYKVQITCEDNGCGMTDFDLANVYAIVGESSKGADYETGGLGIGATTVLIAEDYIIDSLKWRMSRDGLERGADIEEVPERIGTKVWVRSNNSFYWSTFSRIYLMLSLSEIHVRLIYKAGDSVEFDDMVGSMTLPVKGETQHEFFRSWLTECVSIPKRGLYKGATIVRINGLVQFIDVYEHRPTYLWIELPPKSPQDSEWPLTISRESLKGQCLDDYRALTNLHNVDWITSEKIVQKDETVNKIIDGYLLQGSRDRQTDDDDIFSEPAPLTFEFEAMMANGQYEIVRAIHAEPGPSGTVKVTLEDGRIVSAGTKEAVGQLPAWVDRDGIMILDNPEEVLAKVREIPNRIAMYLRDYYPPSDPQRIKDYAKALRAWKVILRMVCDSKEKFGIGATTDQYTNAERVQDGGICYYVLNPDCLTFVHGAEGKALALWQIGCHEAAHYERLIHDERHSGFTSTIARATASEMARALPRLKKMLS